jgi:hypothetical protein
LAADPITFKNQLAYLVPLLVLSAATYRYIEYPRASFEEIFRLQKSAPQTTAALVRLQPSN